MVIACPRDCYDTCIFNEKYKPLNIFPINGFTCSRGISDIKRNSINRISSAYYDGKEISIDEGIKLLAKKIREVKPEEILHLDYDGNQGLLTWYYPARIWNFLGATSTDYSICSSEGHAAIKSHYGSSLGALPEDFEKFNAVVFWGSEASISFIHGWRILKDKYKIVIDVRKSETAKKSEKYFIVKPGSDAYLAIGIMKFFIWKDYIKNEEIEKRVKAFDMETITKATGLKEEEIEELADLYFYYKPLTVIGFALGRSINGGYSIGLISLIPKILGIEKGFFYSNSQGLGIDFDYMRGLHKYKPKRIIGMGEVGDKIDDFKLVFVWNSNPIHSLPRSDKIIEAVNEGKVFLVVHDPFWSETAKIANLVFPAPTFLEKTDVIYSYWHNYLVYNEPIIHNENSISEVELMQKLAKTLEFDEPLLFEDPMQAVSIAIRNTNVTISDLISKKIVKIEPKYSYKFSIDPFPTPEDLEFPQGEFLVYSAHPNYTNSQFKEIYGERKPIAYNSRIDGEGIIETDVGKIKVMFKKSSDIPDGIYFLFKSSLFDLNNKPINSIIKPSKGKFGGTPNLNIKIKNIEQLLY
ncbi:molybdopterin-dependent oxidoreductase [Acidianus sulfidivorans JP7]|uniref:Dehydrogenase n=1 Tax=Acidianus sulfidivorans JP7 TaxID=619593 RepID=A0A2U9IK58_9CREN|nr:molybdopterin-dependent oxidoreductase [Acidianus sulfidivorans]AWR96432.1 molybdopterin-dependent oxidoreductase [Acidianus sulfidivorans JP7]